MIKKAINDPERIVDEVIEGIVFASQGRLMKVPGVRALMRAARHLGRRGEQLLEFGHEIPPIIRRMIDLVGAAQTLWPINHSLK